MSDFLYDKHASRPNLRTRWGWNRRAFYVFLGRDVYNNYSLTAKEVVEIKDYAHMSLDKDLFMTLRFTLNLDPFAALKGSLR